MINVARSKAQMYINQEKMAYSSFLYLRIPRVPYSSVSPLDFDCIPIVFHRVSHIPFAFLLYFPVDTDAFSSMSDSLINSKAYCSRYEHGISPELRVSATNRSFQTKIVRNNVLKRAIMARILHIDS